MQGYESYCTMPHAISVGTHMYDIVFGFAKCIISQLDPIKTDIALNTV